MVDFVLVLVGNVWIVGDVVDIVFVIFIGEGEVVGEDVVVGVDKV